MSIILKILNDTNYIGEYRMLEHQFVVYENKDFYEIYTYKQHESDPNYYDILACHCIVSKFRQDQTNDILKIHTGISILLASMVERSKTSDSKSEH